MNKPTTVKQRKFLRQFIRTGCATEAAMRSFDCKDRKVARVVGSNLLTKLNIQFVELMEKMGLDDEQDVNDLLRLRKAKVTKHFTHEGKVIDEREYEDNQTQLKALEVTLKLKGHLRNRVEHSGKVDGEGNKFLIQFINKKEDIVKDAEATATDIRLQEKL